MRTLNIATKQIENVWDEQAQDWTSGNGGTLYRAACPCGWGSLFHVKRERAENAWRRHVCRG